MHSALWQVKRRVPSPPLSLAWHGAGIPCCAATRKGQGHLAPTPCRMDRADLGRCDSAPVQWRVKDRVTSLFTTEADPKGPCPCLARGVRGPPSPPHGPKRSDGAIPSGLLAGKRPRYFGIRPGLTPTGQWPHGRSWLPLPANPGRSRFGGATPPRFMAGKEMGYFAGRKRTSVRWGSTPHAPQGADLSQPPCLLSERQGALLERQRRFDSGNGPW